MVEAVLDSWSSLAGWWSGTASRSFMDDKESGDAVIVQDGKNIDISEIAGRALDRALIAGNRELSPRC